MKNEIIKIFNNYKLMNILLSEHASSEIIQNLNFFVEMIPDLKKSIGFDQNSKWHNLDLFEHTMKVIDNTPKFKELRLAALFHDLGKIYTYSEDENKEAHFYGHYNESLRIFQEYAKKYHLGKDLTMQTSKLIYFHDYDLKKLPFIRENFTDMEYKMLLDLKRADLLAQSEKYHYLLNDIDHLKRNIK